MEKILRFIVGIIGSFYSVYVVSIWWNNGFSQEMNLPILSYWNIYWIGFFANLFTTGDYKQNDDDDKYVFQITKIIVFGILHIIII